MDRRHAVHVRGAQGHRLGGADAAQREDGRGELALKIREIAREHGVPMLEATPLARALYKHCELEQSIPAALYTAVAEVMAYVYQLDAWMKQGGLPPVAPATLPVPAGMDPGAPEE